MGRPSRTHTNAGPGLTAVARFDDKGTRRVGPSATSEMRTTCPSAHARFSVHVQGFEGKLGSERSERWQGSGARERECARSTQQTKECVQQMWTGLEGKISEGEDSCKEKNAFHPNCCLAPGWAESHRGGEPMGFLPHRHVHARKGQSKIDCGERAQGKFCDSQTTGKLNSRMKTEGRYNNCSLTCIGASTAHPELNRPDWRWVRFPPPPRTAGFLGFLPEHRISSGHQARGMQHTTRSSGWRRPQLDSAAGVGCRMKQTRHLGGAGRFGGAGR